MSRSPTVLSRTIFGVWTNQGPPKMPSSRAQVDPRSMAGAFSSDVRLPTATIYYGAPMVLPRGLDLVPPERLVPPAGDE